LYTCPSFHRTSIEVEVGILVALAVIDLVVLTPQYGNQARIQELKGIVEPLGFDVLSKLDDKSSEHIYHPKPNLKRWMFIRAVCVADNGSTRIIAVDLETRFGERENESKYDYKHYFLGITLPFGRRLL